MRLPIAVMIAFGIGLVTSPARAITLDLSEAVLAGGAEFKGTNIKFAPNQSGSATFTFDSVPNQQYVITVTGHNDNSTSYFNFFVDPDGLGAAPEIQLGGNSLSSQVLSPLRCPRLSTSEPSTRYASSAAGRATTSQGKSTL